MICNDILDALGNTPIIRLNKMTDENDAEILVKFEGLNVGGSIKTRTAFNMITAAEKQGLLNENSVIVEPTSGNQGIGLALVGAVKGYRTVIIMPDSVSEERRKLVRHYGAEVILVHDDDNIGECIRKCIETAEKMAEEAASEIADAADAVSSQIDKTAAQDAPKGEAAKETKETTTVEEITE